MTVASAATALDRAHLERARQLGRRGWGRVHPNPMVGCVLAKDGQIVAEGWHREFGGPHAEVVALDAAAGEAAGATAYVSLEPCDHEGKTPACSQALLRAGVARVVFGVCDPGAESGGGADTLRAAGVEVVGPVWEPREGPRENPAFFHAVRHGTPFVALKLAQSLDGRIAEAPGRTTRITGRAALEEVHRLRAGFDALLVGSGTALADDPLLTVRHWSGGRVPPRRLVLDSHARLPATAAVLRDAEQAPVHVFTRAGAAEAEMERIEAGGAHVHPTQAGPGGLALDAVLATCWDLGIRSVLCEGGARLAASLLGERRAGRVYLFVAPLTLGESGVPAFGEDAAALDWSCMVPSEPPRLVGRDTLLVLDREA